MRKWINILFILLLSIQAQAQFKDTIIQIHGEAVIYDLDLSLKPNERKRALQEFVLGYEENTRSAPAIGSLFSSVPLSNDPCLNNSFESVL